MKPLDLKSTLIAGVVGAITLYIIAPLFVTSTTPTEPASTTTILASGFALGAIVQTVVRITGVS